jgi:hypothetical protein
MKYRAFGWHHGSSGWATHTAHSADGLHWTGVTPVSQSADGVWTVWDPFRGRGAALIMTNQSRYVHGLPRRTYASFEWTREGGPTPMVSALVPDEYDDIIAQARGFRSADYYGLGFMPTPGAMIGFLWPFRHSLPYLSTTRNQFGNWGRIDLSLVYQFERGGRWRHFPGRADWVNADEMPHWARGCLYTASSPVDVGDETWLYFTGDVHRHAWFLGPEWKKPGDPRLRSLQDPGGFSAIGILRWPRDRLLGYFAPLLEKIDLLPRRGEPGSAGRLVLNAVTRPNGAVRVALMDKPGGRPIEGYDFANCEPLVGDIRDAVVRWNGRPDLPATDEATKLIAQLEIIKGTLYAFDFTTPAPPDTAPEYARQI